MQMPGSSACGKLAAVVLLALGFIATRSASAADVQPPPLVEGLKNPESVLIAPDGRMLVSVMGEFDVDGDGSVVSIVQGKAQPIAKGLNDPKGLAAWGKYVFVADKNRVVRIDARGIVYELAGPKDFPRPPMFLNDLAVAPDGTLYVSDCGDRQGKHGAIFRIHPDRTTSTVVDHERAPALQVPNGLLLDGHEHLLAIDFLTGDLHRVCLKDGGMEKIAEGFPGGDGLVRDVDGNLYISQWSKGRVSVIPAGEHSAELVSDKFQAAADLGINNMTGHILVPDMKAGTIRTLSLRSHVPKTDTSPLAVKIEPYYENLRFERPIVLTHGGDDTNRTYVASQLGLIYVLPDDQSASEAELFLDMHEKVHYKDTENEEGFLGLAFHPQFKKNGEFFAYYTTTDAPHVSVISRFRATGPDHRRAESKSEEELLRIPQPFWNHNGGTLAFGPDGYLYVALGDGGAANDPYRQGQDLTTLLGKILRIDVDHPAAGKKYGIPTDNPFVQGPGARPEIFAYGLRNIWRLSFDRETGACWAADVGQDIWEEINLVVPGGNYGWNLREGMHRFTADGSAPRSDLIEPLWEYHHDIGKSVTGGHVYRGKKVPELRGAYLYGDYVTGRIWALNYDARQRKVTANHSIAGNVSPIMSFGEDEAGEVYYMTTQGSLHRFASGSR